MEDEQGLAEYMFQKNQWLADLQPHFPFPVDLQLLDDQTEVIKKGIEECSILVFERD